MLTRLRGLLDIEIDHPFVLRAATAVAADRPLPNLLDHLMQTQPAPGSRDDTVILGLRWTPVTAAPLTR